MKQWQAVTISIMVLFITLILVSGCATADKDNALRIDPRNVLGMVDMRSEITAMLEDLGYQWQPVLNDSTQQRIKVAEKYGQYRMLFRNINNASVQVAVHIRQRDNMTGLHFSEIGNDQPSETAMAYYYTLKERVIEEFGAENVSDDKYSFMMP